MAKHERPEVANKQVTDADNAFADGLCNGYLYCYGTNHQLVRQLLCQAINCKLER